MSLLKLKHLRHPVRTLSTARSVAAARWEMREIAGKGRLRYKNDCRYDLQSVTDGFADRLDDGISDSALLERICSAYCKAAFHQESAPPIYDATQWWAGMRHRALQPVMAALRTRQVSALGKMYRNFFRDPCSTGLLGVPYGMSQAYFGGKIRDVHRQFYLGDALHRLDYWKLKTNDQYRLSDLTGPAIGNPFGVVFAGTLVREGAAYQHYCAHRIAALLGPQMFTVAEIGGGFGGMAYYLLRDHPGIAYVDFDVPESIALASYYLISAFPELRFLLYGEDEINEETMAQFDVVLLPLFELPAVPEKCVDLTFSSHSLSDISSEASVEYVDDIGRMSRSYLHYIGVAHTGHGMAGRRCGQYGCFLPTEAGTSEWNTHRNPSAVEVEFVYKVAADSGLHACSPGASLDGAQILQ